MNNIEIWFLLNISYINVQVGIRYFSKSLSEHKNLKKKLYDPFLFMGFISLKATEPLQE